MNIDNRPTHTSTKPQRNARRRAAFVLIALCYIPGCVSNNPNQISSSTTANAGQTGAVPESPQRTTQGGLISSAMSKIRDRHDAPSNGGSSASTTGNPASTSSSGGSAACRTKAANAGWTLTPSGTGTCEHVGGCYEPPQNWAPTTSDKQEEEQCNYR